ncbi:glycosyltransferase [Actinokineospora auranticolor]|uniref:GT2 family glycosyltransferase n=1 Tax=Actinokineospora auranticolor TaxID=155976 RepID=A0A2S6GQ46_9PSEU|nr:glycosyltransferase [Actinokineospora auranticolor]PPK67348.1 GT2 family glycosyltransferase [Actinokineospora auranticolor]
MISIVVISKDERALDDTLGDLRAEIDTVDQPCEVVVVDASAGRLDDIRDAHTGVRWVPFTRPDGVRVSIPHQRNAGVRAATGDTVVFTDSGCRPRAGWLATLVDPILSGAEAVVAGVATAPSDTVDYYPHADAKPRYLDECPTINLAFRREVFDEIGGFDEAFEYGSDVDFSWRVRDAGRRIRYAPDAVVEHDWGTTRRQLRRSYLYGKARARLYRKHRARRRGLLRNDPVALLWPLFLLGLPLALRFRWYPALLLIPAWRNRSAPIPLHLLLAGHVLYGLGVLAEVGRKR